MKSTVTAETSLEARSLRVTLRLECEAEDHPIFLGLSAPDPRSFLEAKLPAALATVAPQTLPRLLEEIAQHLRDADHQEVASSFSKSETDDFPGKPPERSDRPREMVFCGTTLNAPAIAK